MTEQTTYNQPKRSRGARIALIVTGAVTGLLAAGLLAVGGAALWGDSEKDADGYLSTDTHHFDVGSHALASESLDVDLDGAEWLMDSEDFGEVRLDVEPESDEPVFVGIAPTDEVSRYLRDVAHTSVSDVDSWPFENDYEERPVAGDRTPARPGQQSIWAASAQGAGSQTLKWDVQDGDWSVVVMNADGSAGVDAGVKAGAKVPFLSELGWSATGTGAFLLIAAAGLLVLGIRTPRNRHGAGTGLAPAAA
ncbi:MAG TPA: hypothetical protein VG126_05080 [Thermoleophilaceae bacterium]|nr:hypothetical protein [Thermoleophilaceae bacterium]